MTNLKNALKSHYDVIKESSLLDLFLDPERANKFSLSHGGLWFDYSKNHINDETINLLCEYAQSKGMTAAIDGMFKGEKINSTENRAVLHTALRDPNQESANGKLVHQVLNKMTGFVDKVHSGTWCGYSGKAIKSVVNIGIGGSDLGPRMVTQALKAYQKEAVDVYFVANIDGANLEDILSKLDSETTLFVIASKTFTTMETLNNASSARDWMTSNGCSNEHLKNHFVAIGSNVDLIKKFGIDEDNIFPMWDWVGGRYSMWSAIGLPIALAVGMDNFKALLEGAHEMDRHFVDAPLKQNIPVISALLSFWYSQFWGVRSNAVLPYAQRMSDLPAYLQQLDMESLGKSVGKDGSKVDYHTGLVIWGAEGSNAQHSFCQLLHQGNQRISIDFIVVKEAMSEYTDQHQQLLSCFVSQSQALLQGKTLEQAKAELHGLGLPNEEVEKIAPHKVIPGNRSSNAYVMDSLSPKNMGALIAMYEHKVFASSVLLGINAFDQWGVELGKQLGVPIYDALNSGELQEGWDSSTISLIKHLNSVA